MPLSLTEVKQRTAQCDIYSHNALTGGRVDHTGMAAGDLLVTYRVVSGTVLDDQAAYTRAVAEIGGDPDAASNFYAGLVAQSVVSWDLSLEPGDPPIPLELDVLRAEVPVEILTDVINGISTHKRSPNRPAPRK